MASTQAAARKGEAAINELIQKAKEEQPQDEMIFGGWLYNDSPSKIAMHLHDDHVWSGNFYRKYPEELKESESFVQTEKNENGIKTGVLYSLKTGQTPMNHYGFLLAWSDSFIEGKHTRKTYGYCGLLEKFHKLDWEKVGKELDAATDSFSFIDPLTRTSIRAEIHANVVYAHLN